VAYALDQRRNWGSRRFAVLFDTLGPKFKIPESRLEGQPEQRIQDSGLRIQGRAIVVVAWIPGKG
jgi:hypothetical protein